MKQRPTEEELKEQYKLALEEWRASGDAELWESVTGDGLEDEPAWGEPPAAENDDSGGAEPAADHGFL